MQTVFLLFLFLLQLISFYFIALLYMKVSKFNNLEKKQQQLMSEMDDAIGAYMTELKEENDRLIRIIDKRQAASIQSEEKAAMTNKPLVPEQKKENRLQVINTPSYPMKAAMKSYQSAPSVINNSMDELVTEKVGIDDRTSAIQMYDEGKSIEEIARRLGMGKTEVELLLKFR